MSPTTKKLASLAKYPIAIAILIIVLRQADTDQMLQYLESIPPVWLVISLIAFTIAQYFTIIRMNAYYRWMGQPIDALYSAKLHYVALFYNIILPGGIGGDGYKVYLLKKQAGFSAKEGIKVQLLTRTNGLVVLLLTLFWSTLWLDLPLPLGALLAAAMVLSVALVAIYIRLMPWLLRFTHRFELKALPYSMGVQCFNVCSMLAIWVGLAGGEHMIGYIVLFQLAAIAGMIPITIGGLGIREFTFFYGSTLLNDLTGSALDPELGIVISLMFFAITLFSALIGMIWMGSIATLNPCTGEKND